MRTSYLPRLLSLSAILAVALLSLAARLAPVIDPTAAPAWQRAAAGGIFLASYTALALGRIPGLAIDRAGIALVGAAMMVGSGAMALPDAYRAIDLNTITLLLGMMIVVAHLRLSGFFTLATGVVLRRAGHPLVLLGAIVAVSGVFSAFLVNDAICLVLAPLVLDLAIAMGRKPLPFLLAVAMASNIGSVATITGNPQNMMIGSFSAIPYARFAAALAPVALALLVLGFALIGVVHRRDLGRAGPEIAMPAARFPLNHALMGRAVAATLVMVALFFAGIVPAEAAIVMGALLLLTRRLKAARIYAEIDWSLLLMFAGLFIIVAGAEHQWLSPPVIAAVARLHLENVAVLTPVTAVLSNIVSNVPAVLVLKPFITALADPQRAWLVVAMASTLAGNFTILGSVANLIVVEKAAARGVRIGFWAYFRIGAPLSLASLAIGALWLAR
ncbi:MAG: anion transporter [Rhodospirillales bacterium]|nr:anion transporter [Rhodospirillales bacterium]